MNKFALRALLATAALFGPTAARAEWRKYDTNHFVIYSEAADKDVTRLATRLESIDGLLRMATGIAPSVDTSKVRIYQVPDEDAVERALGEYNSGVAGFYSNNSLGPFAVTPRKLKADVGADFTPELVLFHEYTHHFMLQYSPSTYPNWYTEGFAELIGSSRFMADGKIAYGMPAKQRGNYLSEDWVPVQDLLLRPADKQRNLDLYGQGWALTHFLTFSSTRSPQLRRYLSALASGASDQDAARAFGDLAALNREAHLYVGAGSFAYRPVKVPLTGPVILSSAAISAGEAALIPETIALQEGGLDGMKQDAERSRRAALRAATLASIRLKTAKFPTDRFAQRLLAEAEYGSGHLREAEAATDALLALNANDVGGLARKSIILSTRAASASGADRLALAKTARTLAVKANTLDTSEPLPIVAFYKSFRAAGQTAPPNALDGLAAALDQRPNNEEIRHLLVDELEQRKRYPEAISLIMMIANSPHDSPARDAARVQLERLKAAAAAKGG